MVTVVVVVAVVKTIAGERGLTAMTGLPIMVVAKMLLAMLVVVVVKMCVYGHTRTYTCFER